MRTPSLAARAPVAPVQFVSAFVHRSLFGDAGRSTSVSAPRYDRAHLPKKLFRLAHCIVLSANLAWGFVQNFLNFISLRGSDVFARFLYKPDKALAYSASFPSGFPLH